MALMSPIKDRDWVSVRQANARLSSIKLGPTASPTFAGVTLGDLTASRLVFTNATKLLISKDLIDLVAGTANRVTASDDGSGGVIFITPQDTHTDATPIFTGLTLEDSNDVTYLFADESIFYILESAAIANGNPIGLLLTLTYAGL